MTFPGNQRLVAGRAKSVFLPGPGKIDALDELMRALKKEGDSIGRKSPSLPVAYPPDLASRSLTPGCRHRPCADEHQRGERRGIGDGFDVVALRGSQNRDEITKTVSRATMQAAFSAVSAAGTNHCPYGAETDLQHYRARAHINRFGEEVEMITKGRHDPCVGSVRCRSQKRCWRSF